jgi:hypothetical protein
VIIAGNGTYLAARSLGWPALVVVRTKLKGNSAKAYALADNRTSELARWDYKKLGVSLRGLRKGKIDIEGLGWLDYELAPLLAAFRPPEKGELANKPATPRHLVIIMDDDWGTVERAIGYAREIHGKATSEGKALRIMAGEYIANHKPPRNGRSAPAKAKAKRNGNGKAKRR